VKAKRSRPRIVGYEILRRVEPGEVPGYPLDPRKDRAVLGAREKRYLVPPDVDVFELGLIDRPARMSCSRSTRTTSCSGTTSSTCSSARQRLRANANSC
jgi:hypothetical protein